MPNPDIRTDIDEPAQSNTLTLLERFQSTRSRTLAICESLEVEDTVVQPYPWVSPPKWHLAHTTWFFEEFLLKAYERAYEPFAPEFHLLFNSYYKGVGPHWLQSERGKLSRPTLREVLAFRQSIEARLLELFQTRLWRDSGACFLMEVGLQHEEQHQELLFMDIKSILAMNPSKPAWRPQKAPQPRRLGAQTESWSGPARPAPFKMGFSGNGFCFDNEKPAHEALMRPFAIRKTLVTSGEYLEFVRSGAYQDPALWLSDGWDWIEKERLSSPLYWFENDGHWWEYTLNGPRPVDAQAPVSHISFFEADAYARFVGCRLPTETELEWFLQEEAAPSPSPLPERADGHAHPFDPSLAAGHLWAWSSSPYRPYPGYKAFDSHLAEYNGKFMCNQMVLRGKSLVTPPGHSRPSYRNFFRPEQRWMFSGIALAKELS